MDGFIVINRKLLEWRYHDFPNAGWLWVTILLKANWKDGYYQGELIPRGSFITSYKSLAESAGMNETTVRKWLRRFVSEGMISVESSKKYTSITVLNYAQYQDKNCIEQNQEQSIEQCQEGGQEQGHGQGQDNRTRITRITKQQDIHRSSASEILAYLNERTGKAYKPVESNLRRIEARLKDYSVEDCKKVIDNKCATWLHDDAMSKYLRPETLFNATHFESYLNEVVKPVAPDYILNEPKAEKQELSAERIAKIKALKEKMHADSE